LYKSKSKVKVYEFKNTDKNISRWKRCDLENNEILDFILF